MFDFLNKFRKTRQIKVQHLEYDQAMPEVLVSPKTFQKASRGCLVYETPEGFTFLNEDGATRCLKRNARPPIIKTQKLELHPDFMQAKIVVTEEELFKMALQSRASVIETSEMFLVIGSLTFIAKKRKPKRG